MAVGAVDLSLDFIQILVLYLVLWEGTSSSMALAS